MKVAKCLFLLGFLAGVVGAQPRVVDLRTGEEDRSGNGSWLFVGDKVLYLTDDGRGTGSRPIFPRATVRALGALADDRILVAVAPFLGASAEVWVTDGTEGGSSRLLDGFSQNFFGAGLESSAEFQPRP